MITAQHTGPGRNPLSGKSLRCAEDDFQKLAGKSRRSNGSDKGGCSAKGFRAVNASPNFCEILVGRFGVAKRPATRSAKPVAYVYRCAFAKRNAPSERLFPMLRTLKLVLAELVGT